MPQQLTEEDLKNMSPEQIQALQKQQCIFCHIVSGRVASKKVYEDEQVIAILDINPANPGHVLLLPKEHYSIMPQVPDEIIKQLGVVSKHLSHALLRALKVSGTYIFAANGVVAGQKAAHFMMHIIPRKEGDGLGLELPEGTVKEQQLEQLRAVLEEEIYKTLGRVSLEDLEKREHAKKPEIKIEKPKQKIVEAEFEEVPDLDAISALVASKGIKEGGKRAYSGDLVSSANSGKFHASNCPFAKNIKPENRVYFKTKSDALKEKLPCECVE